MEELILLHDEDDAMEELILLDDEDDAMEELILLYDEDDEKRRNFCDPASSQQHNSGRGGGGGGGGAYLKKKISRLITTMCFTNFGVHRPRRLGVRFDTN